MLKTLKDWIEAMNADDSRITAFAFLEWLQGKNDKRAEPMALLLRFEKFGKTMTESAFYRMIYQDIQRCYKEDEAALCGLPSIWVEAIPASSNKSVGTARVALCDFYLKATDIEKELIVWGLEHFCQSRGYPENQDNIPVPSQEASKYVLEQFAEDTDRSLDELLLYAEQYATTGEITLRGGSELERSPPLGFWVHFRNVTGVKTGSTVGRFYSCSC